MNNPQTRYVVRCDDGYDDGHSGHTRWYVLDTVTRDIAQEGIPTRQDARKIARQMNAAR